MPSAFIDDGYTSTRTIEGGKEFDSFDITYRMLSRSEMTRFHSKVATWSSEDKQGLDPKHLLDFDKLCADIIAGSNGSTPKLHSWSLMSNSGEPVEITAENLLRLHYDAFAGIYKLLFTEAQEMDAAKN